MSYQRLENSPSLHGDAARDVNAGATSQELFDEDSAQRSSDGPDKPWWKANFFTRGPALFDTWDGVFTTVMMNIFGVLIFLRMGWVVGFAGVGVTVLIILITLLLGCITSLSVIGLITRQVKHTRVQQASAEDNVVAYDVFAMIGFVLGERISGSIGLMYAFGHAVAVALYAVGLGEAMSDLFHWTGQWPIRGVALGTTFLLLLVVLAGIRWVVKLQLVLIVVLAVGVLDFMIGTGVTYSPANGVLGYHSPLLHNNSASAFTTKVSFFNVFGVFFPTMTGIAGGLNMACDLRNPARSVPVGTFAALLVSGICWIAMSVMLGATCTRYSLQSDSLIEYRVSLVGALFLIGLYMSSLSSCLAVFCGAPRVLQSMGRAKIIPLLSVISKGRGPNKEPFFAILVVGLVAFVFVFIGHLNTLALLISMPFLLTYTVLNYAYFALAMSDDGIACVNHTTRPLNRLGSLYAGSGGDDPQSAGPADGDDTDPFPEFTKSTDAADHFQRSPSIRRSVHFSESSRLLEGKAAPLRSDSTSSLNSSQKVHADDQAASQDQKEPPMFPKLRRLQERLGVTSEDRIRKEEVVVRGLRRLVSRWVSLLGSILCFVSMFIIHWGFALAAVCIVLVLFIYIGHANPSLMGGESLFSIAIWVPDLARRFAACLTPSKPGDKKEPQQTRMVIIPEPKVPFDVNIVQLTAESKDYSQRDKVHQSVRQKRPADEFSTKQS